MKVTGKQIIIRNDDYGNAFYFMELDYRHKVQVNEMDYQKYKYGDEFPKEEVWTVKE